MQAAWEHIRDFPIKELGGPWERLEVSWWDGDGVRLRSKTLDFDTDWTLIYSMDDATAIALMNWLATKYPDHLNRPTQ